MKKLFILFLLALGISSKAQIMLEHNYDSASTFSLVSQLMIVNFEVSGERYVKIDKIGKSISIYDLNHVFIKTISYASFPQSSNGIPDILYLSETLFDPDSAMEFIYLISDGISNYYTSIYKEDGSLIFYEANAAPWILINVELQQYPIYNTGQGTKMILSCSNINQAKVFSLPGALSTSIHAANQGLLGASSLSVGHPHPNPTASTTTIDYFLPEDVKEGEIVFFDMGGKEIRRFRVDHSFTSLLISTAEIPAGTYLYQLRVNDDASGANRMVVVK